MCSAADSYDVALAAEGVDICDNMFDGDPSDPQAQQKLNYDNTFAFKDFIISRNPYEYSISNIDVSQTRKIPKEQDFLHCLNLVQNGILFLLCLHNVISGLFRVFMDKQLLSAKTLLNRVY